MSFFAGHTGACGYPMDACTCNSKPKIKKKKMTSERFLEIIKNTPEYEPIFKVTEVPKGYSKRVVIGDEVIAFTNGRALYHIKSKQLIPRNILVDLEFVEYRKYRR